MVNKIVNIWTLENTTNSKEIQDYIYCDFVIVPQTDGSALLKELIFPNKVGFVWHITKCEYKNNDENLIVRTLNSVYEFKLSYSVPADVFNKIPKLFWETKGGEPDMFGHPSDKGDVYVFGNDETPVELEVRYLSHCLDDKGTIGYFDIPDNIWVKQGGKQIYSIDNPNFEDMYKVFQYAIVGGLSEIVKNVHLNEFGCPVYVYATDSYID